MLNRSYEFPSTASPLRYEVVQGVTALPLAFSTNSGSIRGGLIGAELPFYTHQFHGDGNGNSYSITRFKHGDNSSVNDARNRPVKKGTWVYLGPMHNHFGHFITESIARTWVTELDLGIIDGVFFLPQVASQDERDRMNLEGPAKWQCEILEYLNITNIEFISEATRFENVIVPEPGTILFSDFIHPQYIEFLRNRSVVFNEQQPTGQSKRKLFYSRGKFDLSFVAEELIIEFLREHNYEVVFPEELTIGEQIALAANAEIALGVQGSAFHIFNLLGSTKTDIGIIQRQSARVTRGFVNTLRPAVKTIFNTPGPVYVKNREGRAKMLVDVENFLSQLSAIDQDISVSAFDWKRAYSETRRRLG